jgi:CRISPR/Cas system CSM-associated protein Csm2 small subunit
LELSQLGITKSALMAQMLTNALTREQLQALYDQTATKELRKTLEPSLRAQLALRTGRPIEEFPESFMEDLVGRLHTNAELKLHAPPWG